MEFRNGKVVHETQYSADPFEAPARRSQWVQRSRDAFPRSADATENGGHDFLKLSAWDIQPAEQGVQ